MATTRRLFLRQLATGFAIASAGIWVPKTGIKRASFDWKEHRSSILLTWEELPWDGYSVGTDNGADWTEFRNAISQIHRVPTGAIYPNGRRIYASLKSHSMVEWAKNTTNLMRPLQGDSLSPGLAT